jgi:hypothetical protein
MPLLMGTVLRTIRGPQLIRHIHTPHMHGVLKVHGRSYYILLYHSVSSRHRGYWHAKIANADCKSREK